MDNFSFNSNCETHKRVFRHFCSYLTIFFMTMYIFIQHISPRLSLRTFLKRVQI